MRYVLWLLVLCSTFAVALEAPAQYYYGGYWGGGFYGGGYYASTVAEGYARGMADLVRAAGVANLMNSEAASNYEDARSKYLDNRVKYAETYFDRRRINSSYREANRKPPPTSEQLYRWAQQGIPKALSASELDPVSGEIDWPIVLRDEDFAPYREQAEQFYASRAVGSADFTFDSYVKFQQATTECQALLKSRLRDYKADDYIRAKKFLDSLAHEARNS